MRRLDLGRATVPVLSGPDRRLDGRRELAAGALAYRGGSERCLWRRWSGTSACARGLPRGIVSTSPGSGARSRANAIGALESPRASITTLARHFGFDAVETEGVNPFRDARPGRGSHSQP